MDNSEFEKYYSEQGFWDKIKKYAASLGREGLKNVLLMYCALKSNSSETPAWAKTVIIGALGYFILPLDAIPDILPVVGFTDDIAVIAAAVAAVRLNIPNDCHEWAETKLTEWLDD